MRDFFLPKFLHNFRSLRTCLQLLFGVGARWDLPGPVRMHSETFACVWMRLDTFRHAGKVLEKLPLRALLSGSETHNGVLCGQGEARVTPIS